MAENVPETFNFSEIERINGRNMFNWLFKIFKKHGIGFVRFTKRAIKVMALAKKEARSSKHKSIGTADILRGFLKEGSGVGFHALMRLKVSPQQIEAEIEKQILQSRDEVYTGSSPQTAPAREVIRLAMEESERLHHHYVGTEHLLLGLLAASSGVAGRTLMSLGIKIEEARETVMDVLGGGIDKRNRSMTREEIETIQKQILECQNKSVHEIQNVLRILIPKLGLGNLNIPSQTDEAVGEGMRRIHALLQTEMMRLICESAEKSCKSAEESSEISRRSCRWAAIAAIASLACAVLTAVSVILMMCS